MIEVILPFFLVGIAILSFVLVGFEVDFYLFKRRRRLQLNLPLFLGLGIGVVGLGQLTLNWFRLPVSQGVVLATFLLLGLPFVLDTRLVRLLKQKSVAGWRKMNRAELAFWVGLGAIMMVAAGGTFAHTIWGSDAYVFWLAKASAFFKDGLVTRDNLFVYWPYDHPLLWPLTATWVYHFLGKVDEYYLQLVPLAIYGALGAAFFQAIPGRVGRRAFWAGLLLLTPFVYQNVIGTEYAGNADLLVGFYLLLGVISLAKREAWLGGLVLFLAAFAKNDALPAVVGFLILLPLARRRFKKNWYWSWLGIAGLLVGHGLWKLHYGLSSRYITGIPSLWGARAILPNLWYTANAFREELRQVSRWGLGWWAILFIFVSQFKTFLRKPRLQLILGLLIFQIIGYFAVYYLTPEDQASQIATSLFRLVLQLYPASLYLAALVSYNRE